MRFCRLRVTSRSSRRRERRIRRKARMRLSESSPSKRLAVWLGSVVATSLLIRVYRRGDDAPTLAESNPSETGGLAPAAKDYFIAILEKCAGLAIGELKRLGPTASELEEAAAVLLLGTGDSAAADDVSGPDIAT